MKGVILLISVSVIEVMLAIGAGVGAGLLMARLYSHYLKGELSSTEALLPPMRVARVSCVRPRITLLRAPHRMQQNAAFCFTRFSACFRRLRGTCSALRAVFGTQDALKPLARQLHGKGLLDDRGRCVYLPVIERGISVKALHSHSHEVHRRSHAYLRVQGDYLLKSGTLFPDSDPAWRRPCLVRDIPWERG